MEPTRTVPICYQETSLEPVPGISARYISKISSQGNDIDSCKLFCNSIASNEYIGLQFHQEDGCRCLFDNGSLPIFPSNDDTASMFPVMCPDGVRCIAGIAEDFSPAGWTSAQLQPCPISGFTTYLSHLDFGRGRQERHC